MDANVVLWPVTRWPQKLWPVQVLGLVPCPQTVSTDHACVSHNKWLQRDGLSTLKQCFLLNKSTICTVCKLQNICRFAQLYVLGWFLHTHSPICTFGIINESYCLYCSRFQFHQLWILKSDVCLPVQTSLWNRFVSFLARLGRNWVFISLLPIIRAM